jgi:hypothetical protein
MVGYNERSGMNVEGSSRDLMQVTMIYLRIAVVLAGGRGGELVASNKAILSRSNK